MSPLESFIKARRPSSLRFTLRECPTVSLTATMKSKKKNGERLGVDHVVQSALDFGFWERCKAKLGASGLNSWNNAIHIVANDTESSIGRVLFDHCELVIQLSWSRTPEMLDPDLFSKHPGLPGSSDLPHPKSLI